jgi:hypothetical protein
VISDYTLDMFVLCANRLAVDPEFRSVVTTYNKSEMYSWFQSSVLHVWLCLGRMYAPPVPSREIMSQEMSDHFFGEVERKLVFYGVTNPLAFNREYKRLAQIFHGTCVAYDKAYQARDDDMLARALWRNLLNQDVDTYVVGGPAEALVIYLKKQKLVLQYCDPEAFEKGKVPFVSYKEAQIEHKKETGKAGKD